MKQAIVSLITLLFIGLNCAIAAEFNTGDYVKLKGSNPLGVPLHKISKPSMFKRLPDGSISVILEKSGNNWYKVDSNDSVGWIVKKYIESVINAPDNSPDHSDESHTDNEIWKNYISCDSLVKLGRTLPKKENKLRIVTWNIRFFPQGNLYGNNPDKFTDQAWLSCTLAWLDPDIIAVQEILDTQEARSAMKKVLGGMYGYNGGNWQNDLQACGSDSSQHVGFIYNEDKVTLSKSKDMWEFNGKAHSGDNPCKGRLRPGRYTYVKSKRQNGIDLHLISVHSDSGKKISDYDNRMTVVNRFDEIRQQLSPQDEDIILIGDFNTMGNNNISASEELDKFKSVAESYGFIDIPAQPQCTEYYNDYGGWLDHIVVSKATQELKSQTAKVYGYCSVAACDILSDMPEAYNKLSDHCPVVIDLEDIDED